MITRILAALLFASFALGASARAQHTHPHQPYAGEENREIKALSEGELRDLESGAGMGLARAAELNGLPGPRHVLDLAAELTISEDQHRRAQRTFDEMQREAVSLGRQIIERERALEQLFRSETINASGIEDTVTEIAHLQGKRRFVHLKAHLTTSEVLTPEQIHHYQVLRGYSKGDHGH